MRIFEFAHLDRLDTFTNGDSKVACDFGGENISHSAFELYSIEENDVGSHNASNIISAGAIQMWINTSVDQLLDDHSIPTDVPNEIRNHACGGNNANSA
jgi:hypothetical protein